jgi:hypothetical protein
MRSALPTLSLWRVAQIAAGGVRGMKSVVPATASPFAKFISSGGMPNTVVAGTCLAYSAKNGSC